MKDSVFQKIINNVNNSVEIRKLAQKENVKYSIAKIMYNNGKCDISEEQAIKIEKASKEFGIPQYIIQSIVIDDNVDEITEWRIQWKIAVDYVLKKYNEPRIKGEHVAYAQKLYKLLKKGFFSKNIKTVDKLLQTRINLYAKLHKVSNLVATLVVTDEMQKEQAKIYEEAVDFIKSKNYDPNYYFASNFRYYLKNSDQFKRKKVHGILIISKTEEGLQKLEEIINKAFEKGNKDFLEILEGQSREHSLIISDYSFNNVSCCFGEQQMIYLETEGRTLESIVSTFFHEVTHFIDYNTGDEEEKNHYSEIAPKMRGIFEKIRFNINNSPFESIINNKQIPLSIRKFIQRNASKYNIGLAMIGFRKGFKKYHEFRENLAKEYAKDERLIKKWKEEIDKKYAIYSREDRELFLKQKIHYEKKKYIALISAIHDIYDGMAMGRLRTYFKISGHGKEYYSIENKDLIECIAEIGRICNSDGQDILEYEFGVELANEIIQIYKEMLEKSKDKIKNNTLTSVPSNNNQQMNETQISLLKKWKQELIENQLNKGQGNRRK